MTFGRQNLGRFTCGKFSTPAVFELAGGLLTIRGVFDNAYFNATIGESVLETSAPRLMCRNEEAVSIPRETIATIEDGRYSVLQVQPDYGTGFAVITFAHEEAE